MKLSRKIATLLFYSTLLLSIIISAIFIFIVYKLKENSVEIIINYRLTLFLILFLLTLINIGLYLFFNKNIIKRLELIEKSMRKLIRTTDKKNNNFKDDEISKLDDEINIVLDKLINTEIHLQEEEKNYANILNAMSNSFFHLKAIMNNEGEYIDGVIIDVNFAGTELLGLSQEDIINNKLSDIYQNFSRDKDKILEILTRIKDSKSECIAQEINIVDDKWGVVSVYSLNKGYFSIIVNDVTEIKKYAEDMTYLANYDTLTNLLNRHNLLEYLIELISRDEKFSIYFIDLDDFKNINDTLGHNTGDEILRVVADRLTDLYSDDITVGRLGGDEFILVKRGESDLDNIKDIAEETLKLLNKNIQFSRYNFSLKASIGISYYPDHAEDVFTLLKYADISMYEGKQEGGNKYKIFSEEMLEDLNLESRLSKAIDNNEFEVYYQPIYDVKSKKIVGAEALSRWISSTGIISPTKFIPLAKKNGDIIRIDEFVLKESCEFCKKMRSLTEEDFKVSVNISYTALKQINFLERVMSIVNESNVNPNFIKIEITEDEIIDNIESTVNILNKLRKLGFNIALDDFGVGYSSFNYIKTLPLDTLKIDRSLLISVENDKKTFAIIKTLINLAHTLGLDVVCEGVEMKNQLELLTNIECDKIQGYYISKPLKLNDFYKLILNFNNIETCFKEVAVTN
ncbi:MAG: EAL domain-containing protein [Clostridium sp.]|uniref:sensor domain-containing protein n=2 Tax=Clostridium sp. TaxID=1506 RepID=UPI00290F3B79|nr:EAL domain-containing protein [Clostridium sp.]MDU7149573.1 EAL domain-containing protein [Clostridium sp.]MDU7242889.1 EAL domain-containing protein [Clostridium sp.]